MRCFAFAVIYNSKDVVNLKQSPNLNSLFKSLELRVIIIILTITVALSAGFYLIVYSRYYQLTIDDLKDHAVMLHKYAEEIIDDDSFKVLNSIEDESKEIYIKTYDQLNQVRRIANIRYLYTAKRSESGELIYVLDGLDPSEEDFRHVGMPIEEEIISALEECLNGTVFLDDDIMVTEWGIVYVTYFPVHGDDGSIIGAIGMEFDCAGLYKAFQNVRFYTVTISLAMAAAASLLAILFIKKIVRTTENEIRIKDELLVAAKEEALSSNKAKSDFLSRMSHEMRTPMNAIIGMTKIAVHSADIDKMRYCVKNIASSSGHLLHLINDVLDMSKIEAGKFELDLVPTNIEKMLMEVCNLVVDKAEQKNQKLDVVIPDLMGLYFLADEHRLSQVIINLLSNAVKFTPEGGDISLSVIELEKQDDSGLLQFTVSDTGIGMSEEQLGRLFTSFEQADGSISRRFGGTGLGLAISKSIVEKMGGSIRVESELGKGSRFMFTVRLEKTEREDKHIVFDGIKPDDIKLLIIAPNAETRARFCRITGGFGMRSYEAGSGAQAVSIIEAARAKELSFDVVFMDHYQADMGGIELFNRISHMIDKSSVVVITSFLEWNKTEKSFYDADVHRFITKPLFPSAVLDCINEVIGNKGRRPSAAEPEQRPAVDLSEVSLLLAEDVEINREIFMALLEETGVKIDIAENGRIAVEKFKENPQKYDIIIMDIQMPETDGYEATRQIRSMQVPKAKVIPIIAMTANAFSEDIERCLEAGMNDHLSKPIDDRDVIEKIRRYTSA